jgi:hypothetical protein
MFGKILVLLAFLIISCFSNISSAEEKIDNAARAVADKYLKGMVIADLPEGRQMISESAWPDWGSNPVLLKHETIFEGMIDTDVPTIKGYKRLIDAQVESQAGTPLPQRHILVAYPNNQDKKWRVLVFSTGINVERQIASNEKSLGDTSYNTKDQINYRRLAYWYAAAGRLNDSYQAYKKAGDLNRKDPDNYTKQSVFDASTETLKKILGK